MSDRYQTVLLRLPPVYREAMAELSNSEDRPMAHEYRRAVREHLKRNATKLSRKTRQALEGK